MMFTVFHLLLVKLQTTSDVSVTGLAFSHLHSMSRIRRCEGIKVGSKLHNTVLRKLKTPLI